MLIDGQFIAISEEQENSGREQLELPSGYFLAEATRLLHHDTGSGMIQISLCRGLLIVAYENTQGHRRYGVVHMDKLGN